jgi:predicted sulfurtransferase
MDHDDFRIALYYCYIDIPDTSVLVAFHDDCNSNNCNNTTALLLGGRIRVAREGLNGVLSGLMETLQEYEAALRTVLREIWNKNNDSDNNDGQEPFELDIKYCRLRPDLDVSSQLFTELLVQKTGQVVGLVDMNGYSPPSSKALKKTKNKTSYSVRKREKREQNRKAGNKNYHRKVQELFQQSLDDVCNTAPHLSPTEWNEHLASLQEDDNAILLDCRNSYESAVGYFAAPNTSTVLTNTRKYSELPMVLLSERDRLRKASHIFMYCTGGVRCERASGFLLTLLPNGDDSGDNNSAQHATVRDTPHEASSEDKAMCRKIGSRPQIYQLRGGIQRYIESDNNSLFHGKNFVFDPRRTDPLFNPAHGVVGECLVCTQPCDDYDNGHAPADNKEARCCQCRVLVLVCNICRCKVQCCGDSYDNDDDDDCDGGERKPRLFCGGKNGCLHMPPVGEIRS